MCNVIFYVKKVSQYIKAKLMEFKIAS